MSRRPWLIITLTLFVSTSCENSDRHSPLVEFHVTIDWVPSPEYYGFFYAKAHRIYSDHGLEVTIHNGTGAPAVAGQLAAGSIYAATTTSDNLLRQVARGARFHSAVPVQRFNPSVVASLSANRIGSIRDLRGKRLGTNKQSSVYLQFLYAARRSGLQEDDVAEYPVGYGGAAQLKAGLVDAFLAYSTNAVVDLERERTPVTELFLSSHGVKSYGLVLVVAESARWPKEVTDETVRTFIAATLEGFAKGLSDTTGTVAALQSADPTLDPEKAIRAIRKIDLLNKTESFPVDSLDVWVEDVTADDRRRAREFYIFP